jgi:class 3 adenylate cyclase
MPSQSRIGLYTFLAVFFSILAVGLIVVPLLLNVLQRNYLRLQSDVNYRQAKAMAQFVQSRIQQGASEEEIIGEFQASIAGSDMDRGYTCLVDNESTDYLSHPMTAAVGMSVATKQALYDSDFDGDNLVRWEQEIQQGNSGGGLLFYPDEQPDEVIYFYTIPEFNWTISSHENASLVQEEVRQIRNYFTYGSLAFGFLLAFPVSIAVRRVSRRYENQILREQEKSDRLLLNILPPAVARRMKEGEAQIVDHCPAVSVLFCDLVDFTRFASENAPEATVDLLNRIFSDFDSLCDRFGVEKIKTIGDAYMVVAGLPDPDPEHATKLAGLALEMVHLVEEKYPQFNVRIGIHSGEVVAGVIGKSKFSYDLWGDTVNTASRLESNGLNGRIQVSAHTQKLIQDEFELEYRGKVNLKGKGEMDTFLMLRKKQDAVGTMS